MWTKLVEIILGKLMSRLELTPRQALARATIDLHKGMNDCHRAYLDFRKEYEQLFVTSNPTEWEKIESWKRIVKGEDAWASAIVGLAEAVYRMETVIDIFDSEVLAILQNYVNEESRAYHCASSRMWSSLDRPDEMYMRVPLLAGAIGRNMPEYHDDPHMALEEQDANFADFLSARQKLRSFITDTLGLEPEEVFEAT